jgi:hypothetical protein
MKWYWWALGAGALYFLLKKSGEAADIPGPTTGEGEVAIGTPTLVSTESVPPDFLQKLVAFYTMSAQKNCTPDLDRPDKFCCPEGGTISALAMPNGVLQIVCVTKTGKYVVDQFASLSDAYTKTGYLFK